MRYRMSCCPILIDLYKQGRLPFDKMITYYPFDKINEAVADAEEGKGIEGRITFLDPY